MPKATEPEIPVTPAAGPQGEAAAPIEGSDAVKKMTHEVDADDMFNSTT